MRPGPSSGARDAAHFENVGEVIVETKGDRQVDLGLSVVAQHHALPQSSRVHIERPLDVNLVLSQHEPAVAEDIGIGQIGVNVGAVLRQTRPEQQGVDAHDRHAQVREIPRVSME